MPEDNMDSEGTSHERNLEQREKELKESEVGKTKKQIATEKAHMPSEEAAEMRNTEARRESKKKQRRTVSKGKGGEKSKMVKRKKSGVPKGDNNVAVGGTFDYSHSRDKSQDFSSNRDTSQDYSRVGLRAPQAIAEEKSKLRTEEIAKEGAPGADELADVEKGYSGPAKRKGKK